MYADWAFSSANNLNIGKDARWISKLLHSKEKELKKEERKCCSFTPKVSRKAQFCYACLFQVLLENCLSITPEVNIFMYCIANTSPAYNSWFVPFLTEMDDFNKKDE